MGVVNVTPDSFSDGGRWFEPEAAVAHGLALLDQGADLARRRRRVHPARRRAGAPAEERARVLPVVARAGRGRARW